MIVRANICRNCGYRQLIVGAMLCNWCNHPHILTTLHVDDPQVDAAIIKLLSSAPNGGAHD